MTATKTLPNIAGVNSSSRGKGTAIHAFSVTALCVVVLYGYFFFFVAGCAPHYWFLKRSLASAIRANPRLDGVEAWLDENKIHYHLSNTPVIHGAYGGTLPTKPTEADSLILILHDNAGFTGSDVERSSKVIATDQIRTETGGANGYFLFSSDGLLIAYHLDSFYLGP